MSKKSKLALTGIFALFAYIALFPSWRHSGWPDNHEGLHFAGLTQAYAAHFRQGDFFPIWSSSDAYGYGTPTLFYYHKVFYYLSGFIYLITGQLKITILLSLSIFMTIGQWGVFQLNKKYLSTKISIFLSFCFIFSTYTFNDWLTRGAMAEFSFMMLTPWFVLLLTDLAFKGTFSYKISLLFFVMFFAHSSMALTLIIPGLICFALAFYHFKEKRKLILKRAIVSVLFLGLAFSPWFYLFHMFNKDYDPASALNSNEAFFTPKDNTSNPFVKYYDWYQMTPKTIDNTTALLNPAMLNLNQILLLVFFAAFIVFIFKKNYSFYSAQKKFFIFSLIGFALSVILQTKISTPLWNNIPGAELIQFPWRLQNFSTLFLILLIGVILASVNRKTRIVLASLITVGLFLESPILRAPVYHLSTGKTLEFKTFYSSETFEAGLGSKKKETVLLTVTGEYLPPVYEDNGERVTLSNLWQVYQNDSLPKGACTFTRTTELVETETVKFSVFCPTQVTDEPIPQHYSWASKFILNGKKVTAKVGKYDGRAVLTFPSGTSTLVSIQPTLKTIIFD